MVPAHRSARDEKPSTTQFLLPPAVEEPSLSPTSILRTASDTAKAGFWRWLLHIYWRTSFRLSISLLKFGRDSRRLFLRQLSLSRAFLPCCFHLGLRTLTKLQGARCNLIDSCCALSSSLKTLFRRFPFSMSVRQLAMLESNVPKSPAAMPSF